MEVKIKKLEQNVTVPTKGTKYSAGRDICAWLEDEPYEQLWLNPNETKLVSTKFAIKIPIGHFGGIFARSGLATKKGLAPINGVGIIDSDYTGEVKVPLHNHSSQKQLIKNGERIAQLIIIPYVDFDFDEVEELASTNRGEGGFGSTGN